MNSKAWTFKKKTTQKNLSKNLFLEFWIKESYTMYVCISLYSLPFMGFESSRIITNKSLKITQKPPSIIGPATWSLFPGGH